MAVPQAGPSRESPLRGPRARREEPHGGIVFGVVERECGGRPRQRAGGATAHGRWHHHARKDIGKTGGTSASFSYSIAMILLHGLEEGSGVGRDSLFVECSYQHQSFTSSFVHIYRQHKGSCI